MNGPQIIVFSIEVFMRDMCGVGLSTKYAGGASSKCSLDLYEHCSYTLLSIRLVVQISVYAGWDLRDEVDPCERHPQDVIQSTGRFLRIATYLVK